MIILERTYVYIYIYKYVYMGSTLMLHVLPGWAGKLIEQTLSVSQLFKMTRITHLGVLRQDLK